MKYVSHSSIPLYRNSERCYGNNSPDKNYTAIEHVKLILDNYPMLTNISTFLSDARNNMAMEITSICL